MIATPIASSTGNVHSVADPQEPNCLTKSQHRPMLWARKKIQPKTTKWNVSSHRGHRGGRH